MKRNKLAILNSIVGVILVSIIFYQQHELKVQRKKIVDNAIELLCYDANQMKAEFNGDNVISLEADTKCTKTGNDLAKDE